MSFTRPPFSRLSPLSPRRTPIRPVQLRPTTTTRRLTTTTPLAQPTAVNAAARPDLLERSSQRALPTLAELSSWRRWARTLPVFILGITAAAACIFNYEKASSPIVAATLYALRTSPRVRQELGDEVYFARRWAWIWGRINLVQGDVDVSFKVRGTRGEGMCRFKAKRVGGKHGLFKTEEWSLTLDNSGTVIQLLEDDGRDPAQLV